MLILCWASVLDNWHTSIQHFQSYSVNRIGLHRPNVFLMLGLCRKRWTNIKPILGQCVVLTETAHQHTRWPSAGFMLIHNLRCCPKIKRRVAVNITLDILLVSCNDLTQKQVYNNTSKRRTSNAAFMLGRQCIGWTNYNTTQIDCMYW